MTDLKVVDREQTAVQEKVADPLDLILKNHSLVSSTLSKESLMKIEQRMPEIMRATNTAGRRNTQTTSQLMTLNMSGDEPYRHLRQILAQIDKKRSALESSHFRVKKQVIKLKSLEKKIQENPDDELAVVQRDEIMVGLERSKVYVEGAIKELGMFQDAYDEIRESHGIPEKWDETHAEKAEVRHHIKMGFRNGFQEIMASGMVGRGTAEYLEQFGIHPQAARKHLHDYVVQNENLMNSGKEPNISHFHEFLDAMADRYAEAHHANLKRIGLKKLVRDDWCYKELTNG